MLSRVKKALWAAALVVLVNLVGNSVWIWVLPNIPARAIAYFNLACAALLVASLTVLVLGLRGRGKRRPAGPRGWHPRLVVVLLAVFAAYNLTALYILRIHATWWQWIAINALPAYGWFLARRWAARRKRGSPASA